jgi:cryptochrome 1
MDYSVNRKKADNAST